MDPSSLTLEVEAAVDDVAPLGRISYALYLGEGEDAVRLAQAPVGVLLPANVFGEASPGTVQLRRERFRTPPGIWAQVEAFDQAGNSSGRSEPFPVTEPAAGRGCQALPRAPFAQLAWPVFALVLMSVRRRASGPAAPAGR